MLVRSFLLAGFVMDNENKFICFHTSSKSCDSCITCQDRVPAFSPKKARALIESELGAPVDILYKEFEDQPIAAASLGQVSGPCSTFNVINSSSCIEYIGKLVDCYMKP